MKRMWLWLAIWQIVSLGVIGCSKHSVTGVNENPQVISEESSLEKSMSNPPDPQSLSDQVVFPCLPWYNYISIGFGWVVPGSNPTRRHVGDDCVLPAGTQVVSSSYGTVKFAHYQGPSWGYLIIIEHWVYINNQCIQWCGVYGHVSRTMYVREGQTVYPGQNITRIGTTAESGQSTPHLHYGHHWGSYGTNQGWYPAWCCGYTTSSRWNIDWTSPTQFIDSH